MQRKIYLYRLFAPRKRHCALLRENCVPTVMWAFSSSWMNSSKRWLFRGDWEFIFDGSEHLPDAFCWNGRMSIVVARFWSPCSRNGWGVNNLVIRQTRWKMWSTCQLQPVKKEPSTSPVRLTCQVTGLSLHGGNQTEDTTVPPTVKTCPLKWLLL